MIKLFLWNFRDFVGFIIIFFSPDFRPVFVCQAWPVDRVGRPHQRSQSTDPVDRRARIRARWLQPWPVDRVGRPTESSLLSVCFGRPGGRPVAATFENSNVGRSTGPVDRQGKTGNILLNG